MSIASVIRSACVRCDTMHSRSVCPPPMTVLDRKIRRPALIRSASRRVAASDSRIRNATVLSSGNQGTCSSGSADSLV